MIIDNYCFWHLLWCFSDYKKKIEFEGQLLIEPKPKEPTKHQYDYGKEIPDIRHALVSNYWKKGWVVLTLFSAVIDLSLSSLFCWAAPLVFPHFKALLFVCLYPHGHPCFWHIYVILLLRVVRVNWDVHGLFDPVCAAKRSESTI